VIDLLGCESEGTTHRVIQIFIAETPKEQLESLGEVINIVEKERKKVA